MKKKIATLKKIKHLSFFFQSKNDWSNWSFYLYDPFFFLFVNFFIGIIISIAFKNILT